ncbi:MAG TPA: hypothetical protein VLJ88_11905 [Propionibacteriaceae bacterium]|nr:hypothetical protein [Propionibacteriaceae bacterium]
MRGLRSAAAMLVALGLLLVTAACGNDAQTLQPYTPAEGVNVDVGDPAMVRQVVHVRNLLIISRTEGQGVVSATIVTDDRDELTALSGVPIKVDGTEGAPFTATLSQTVSFGNGAQIVLTDRPLITVTSPDLVAGRSSSVTMQFEKAGEVTVLVPIVDGNEPQYATISPSPAPAPSA